MEIALLLGVGRRIVTREDANQADVVRAIANDLEGLHEPGEPIALDAHLFLDLGGRLRGARILDRDGRLCGLRLGQGRRLASGRFGLGGRAFGRARFRATLRDCRRAVGGGLGRGRLRGLGGNRRGLSGGRRGLGGGRRDLRGGRRGLRGGRRGLDGGRRGLCLRCCALGRGLGGAARRCRGRGTRGTVGATNHRRLTQDGAGELGDGLHGASI